MLKVRASSGNGNLEPITRAFLTVDDVAARVGFCRATIYKFVREGRFPKQAKIPGCRRAQWSATAVEAWIASVERTAEAG